MNQRGEAGALAAHQRAVPPLDFRHSDRTQEDVARDRYIGLGARQDGRIVGESAQQFRPVVQESLYFQRSSGTDRLLRPRVYLAPEGAGVDDDQMTDGHIASYAVMFTVRPPSTTN